MKIPYAGQVYGIEETNNLLDVVKKQRIAGGQWVQEFEGAMCRFLGVKFAQACNSGSSANLLAISALTSPKLKNEPVAPDFAIRDSNASVCWGQSGRRLRPGDEVITAACAFPTTVAPIVQNGLVPVFVDITLPTYNVDVSKLEEALSERTGAVFIAHTLGNPFDIEAVLAFCKRHGLWLIEDNCDSLGSKYFKNAPAPLPMWAHTGGFGDISTSSFYPPHHITTGEGGMVMTNNATLRNIIRSFRDWGRDCHCEPGEDGACLHRFGQRHGCLPHGYDHKYVYSHLGYNLKMTEPSGALGVAQMGKLEGFIEKRQRNWSKLRVGLNDMQELYILPEATLQSIPSWFSFMLTIRKAGLRERIVEGMEYHSGIQTRPLFSGNILNHPCMEGVKHRVVGDLKNATKVMNDGFMVGVWPGLTEENIDYMIEHLRKAAPHERKG